MEYLGEWIGVAHAGRFLVALAFVSALVATGAFWKGNLRLGRRAYLIHAGSTLGVIVLIFVLFFGHRYEFQYIWKHLNNDMPMRFVLSAFWGGQEGGFLLWMFWHNVLALFILRRADDWQREVMTVLSSIQAFLGVMLLGIYFGDFQLGLDPFLLLREAPNNIGLPWTARADYLTAIPQFADGQGLNPLLQNYWMTIHPPTLFLGFAACSVPFAYAVGALWRRDLTSWIKPVLPWAFFAVGILGAGILMGGAWAYEALSFGGFWAWDPVENSSLVPWMVLVAAAHLLLINRNRKQPTALFSTVYLSILSFLLVLYSTFLTKSGVLGDTSVHSFVDSGILPQLLAYLLAFVALGHLMLLEDAGSRKVYGGLAMATLGLVAAGQPALGFLAFLAVMAAAAAGLPKGIQGRPRRGCVVVTGVLDVRRLPAVGPWGGAHHLANQRPRLQFVLGTVCPIADVGGRCDRTGVLGRFGPTRPGPRHRLGPDLPRGSGAVGCPHFPAHWLGPMAQVQEF